MGFEMVWTDPKEAEIRKVLEQWAKETGIRARFCAKCIKALIELKGKAGMKVLEKFTAASTMWEDEVLEGNQSQRKWLEYEICRLLHGWTLDDKIRYQALEDEF